MKSTVLRLAFAALILAPYSPAVAAKCSPTGVCTACKNCTGCTNCAKNGGTCSVCRSTTEAAQTKTASAKTKTPPAKEPYKLYDAFEGKVVGISDGDTISVMRNGKVQKVRLHGVDAPEKKQPFGERAKQFTSERTFGQKASVLVMDTDHYGRAVGVVIMPNERESLNIQIVRAGLAWHYRQYAPKDTYLIDAQQEARLDRRGLWVDTAPIAPWNWRKARKR